MRDIRFRAFQDNKMIYPTGALANIHRFFRVVRENAELMQFTGLNDKHGTPIYEGDILKSPFFEDMNVAVIWNTKHAQFTFGGAEFNVEVKPEDIEVMGNIFENKDLLNNNI